MPAASTDQHRRSWRPIIVVSAIGLLSLLALADAATKPKAAPLPTELSGKAVTVHDGDTLTLLVGRQQYKVRLEGIDAPELGQDFGTRAKQALSSKVFGHVVRVTTNGRDKYGRVLGTVWLGGESVNKALVAEGWAWHYKEYSKDEGLAEAEKSAREAKTGLWAGKSPVPPWDYRKQERERRQSKSRPPKSGTERPSGQAGLTHWLNTSSGVRHNAGCKYFKNTRRGRLCGPDEGKACGICGG